MLSKTVINSINTDISHIEGNISLKYPDNKIKKVGAFTDIEKDKKSTLFYINDIDIEIILQYYKNCNENIHYIISQFLSLDNPTINKVYKYIDMKTYLPKSIFKFPWFIKSIINDKETKQTFCNYDKNETKNWVDNLKSNNVLNVSTDDLIKIEEILENKIIQIENLVEIEFILTKYISFNWSLDDIKNGEKTFLNTKYKLEDIFKENNENGEMLLCTLLCSYNSIYFKFDITFTKQKEQTFEYKRQLYKYFNQDWYRIFKSVFKNIVRKNIDTQDKFTLGLLRDYNKTKMISSKLSLFSMLNTILETKILNIEQFNKFSEQLFIQFPSIENWDLYIKNIEKDLFVLCKNSIIKYNRLIGYYRRKEITNFFFVSENLITPYKFNTKNNFTIDTKYLSMDFVSKRSFISKQNLIDCVKKSLKNTDKKHVFTNTLPISRLFIIQNKGKILIDGFVTEQDLNFFLKNEIISDKQFPLKTSSDKHKHLIRYLLSGK